MHDLVSDTEMGGSPAHPISVNTLLVLVPLRTAVMAERRSDSGQFQTFKPMASRNADVKLTTPPRLHTLERD